MPKAKKEKKEAAYFTWAHNIEGCLRNGSFVRRDHDGVFVQYMNGDCMGIVDDVPKGMKEVAQEDAKGFLPKCCGGYC